MPKNRTIPFGYCMKNGEITTEPKEVYAVVAIFDEYLKGRSLSEIAKLMQSEKIRYNAISDKWNKNMVKRIIENERYLGTEKYPQLIAEDIFRQANEKRVKKATTLNLISDDLQEIRKTLEAYTASTPIEGEDEASACGVGYSKDKEWNLIVKVTTGNTVKMIKIDRFD